MSPYYFCNKLLYVFVSHLGKRNFLSSQTSVVLFAICLSHVWKKITTHMVSSRSDGTHCATMISTANSREKHPKYSYEDLAKSCIYAIWYIWLCWVYVFKPGWVSFWFFMFYTQWRNNLWFDSFFFEESRYFFLLVKYALCHLFKSNYDCLICLKTSI